MLIIYLQYNYIASKLPLNWPKTVLDFAGIIQIFFGNGEGIFSVDCLLQARSAHVARCCILKTMVQLHGGLVAVSRRCILAVPSDLCDVLDSRIQSTALVEMAFLLLPIDIPFAP